jgi:hypothetical protein
MPGRRNGHIESTGLHRLYTPRESHIKKQSGLAPSTGWMWQVVRFPRIRGTLSSVQMSKQKKLEI